MTEGMQFHFASEYRDVYEVAFDHEEQRRREAQGRTDWSKDCTAPCLPHYSPVCRSEASSCGSRISGILVELESTGFFMY